LLRKKFTLQVGTGSLQNESKRGVEPCSPLPKINPKFAPRRLAVAL
jgi:hypothetical protein